MIDYSDKIFILCILLFEIIFLIVCIINVFYFYSIYGSNNSVISESTAQILYVFGVIFAILLTISIGFTVVIYQKIISDSNEENKQKQVLDSIGEKKSNEMPKVLQTLVTALKTSESKNNSLIEKINNYKNILLSKDEEIKNNKLIIEKKSIQIDLLTDELNVFEKQ